MNLTELFVAQLRDEAQRTRRTLEAAPSGRDDWKPHERSMPFGRLAALVARMPTWFGLIINQDELDLAPAGGSNVNQAPLRTSAELVDAHDAGVKEAGEAFGKVTDDFLLTPWRLLVAGAVASEQPRHVWVRETFMHWSHHRGQLTVYLRLNGASVPAIYGPSADDSRFA